MMDGSDDHRDDAPPAYDDAVIMKSSGDADGAAAPDAEPEWQPAPRKHPLMYRAGKWQEKSHSTYDLASNQAATLPVDPPVQGATSGDEEWPCSACTFLNHPAMDRCECCELPRSVKPRLPDVRPTVERPGATGMRPPRVGQPCDSNLARATSEPSFGFSAALVRAPIRAELLRKPGDRPASIAEVPKPTEPDANRPEFNTYISQEDTPLSNDKTEMCSPDLDQARFLPSVSPEDVTVTTHDPRTVSMRLQNEAVMDTCLDDAADGLEPAKEDDFRPARMELFDIQDAVAVEEGGERAEPKGSFISRALYCLKEPTKKCIIVAFFIILAIIVFLGVFPPSFVYLDYGYVGLMKTKSTGYVNTKDVIYPGCHVLGPDIELKIFTTSALTVDFQDVQSFLKDQMSISFDCNFQYFVRPESVGRLHDMYDMDFKPVIEKIAFAALKTTTTEFSLENIRLNRSFVEKHLHEDLQKKLGGDCCPICCEDSCSHHPFCKKGCNSDTKTCDPGYHVDIRYFNFGAVALPSEVTSRLLTIALLHVKAETEVFKQEFALTEKDTKQKVQAVLNEAAEIKNQADVKGQYIVRVATANATAHKSKVDVEGLKGLCANLGITKMEHKLSAYMLKTFNGMDNLYMDPGWKNASSYAGRGST